MAETYWQGKNSEGKEFKGSLDAIRDAIKYTYGADITSLTTNHMISVAHLFTAFQSGNISEQEYERGLAPYLHRLGALETDPNDYETPSPDEP